jgi:hypothetical protein
LCRMLRQFFLEVTHEAILPYLPLPKEPTASK